MIDYDDVVKRIQAFWATSTPAEKNALKQILTEISDIGESPTYEKIWLTDYKEIPADIDIFLDDNQYLGIANNGGNSIYPFWRQCMERIFHAGNKYEEIFFTGATRTGKSSTGVTCTAYMLYKMMCLQNPQKYFQKKEISKFTLLFFNLTLKLAKSVAYSEFNSLLKTSPWFNDHGSFSQESVQRYIPEGDKIEVDFGSDASNALGKQVFCFIGSTKILTSVGIESLESLDNQFVYVKQYNLDTGYYIDSFAKVVKLGYTHQTVKVYLSDSCYVECTPDHLFMLNDGTYKQAKLLKKGIQLRRGNVYRLEHVFHESAVDVYDVYDAMPYHNFVVSTEVSDVIVHNCGFVDEINFSRSGVKDVQKSKEHMSSLFTTVTDRVKGTFRMNGEVYGKIFAISSKRSDSDYMEEYIHQQQAAGYGEHMFVADRPQWEVQPASNFSKERFYIAVGDRYHKGFVVEDDSDEALDELIAQGYRLLQPPIDYKSQFQADFDIALRDIAGISVPGALSAFTQKLLDTVIDSTLKNPFHQDILEIGMKDNLEITDFFHLDCIPNTIRRCPCYIHLDLSEFTDKSGIGCVAKTGTKDVTSEDGRSLTQMPVFTHIFSISIHAPRGDTIPYAKIQRFILWLRKNHFNIAGISRDQYQSSYMGQLLTEEGFQVDKISLDRTPDGYDCLKNVMLEDRIRMLDQKLLQHELIFLQKDAVTGKYDHPLGGSKDAADGFAGAVWNGTMKADKITVPTKKAAKAALAAITSQNNTSQPYVDRMFGNIKKY